MSRIPEKQVGVEEIELRLSLSLNGKFGVDPNAKAEEKTQDLMLSSCSNLVRTCSVQVENGEREGKNEIIRKMAKRKRMERMNIVRAVRERVEGDGFGGSRSKHGNEANCNLYGYGRGLVSRKEKVMLDPLDGVVQVFDGGCSEVSDPTEHQQIQAVNNSGEARSASSSAPEHDEQREQIAVIPGMATPSVAADTVKNVSRKKAIIKEMASRGWPYVFTTLDDSNNVKVEGFLQNSGHGQPVRIVCVCHGVYHSPAEFVRHAGGGDAVENPLKHIVVTLPSVS